MKYPEPNICVNVDVTNPGQFFACCGLLELADRLWPGAEGWFEEGEFCINSCGEAESPNDLIRRLLECPELQPGVTKESVLDGSKLKLLPFQITFPRSTLRIDWWRDEISPPRKESRETCEKSEFRTWAGNQSPQQIVYDKLIPAIRRVMASDVPDWFHCRYPLSGRFGFDHVSALTALDAGWSPDKHEITVSTSPTIELLGMVGLQRFRPASTVSRRMFIYHVWSIPSSVIVAPAMVTGLIEQSARNAFQFSIKPRGDYKYFSPATYTGEST